MCGVGDASNKSSAIYPTNPASTPFVGTVALLIVAPLESTNGTVFKKP
jgi:hypothetical protein